MNAYELADELAECIDDGSTDLVCVANATNMLRQQADRIAELEKDGKVCATCGGLVYDPVLKQTKPLSDEEIKEILKKSKVKVSGLEAYDICYPQNYRLDEKMFARAIEERHGIK